ncbi:MAG: hypothetical protein JRN02_04865 [Nitrososphaerota archaeon]|nr:hypothetical protein [Nitrososphaerota archaeon]MDG7049561.1 hypothetical protein [Nitrososphaerota archaeon]
MLSSVRSRTYPYKARPKQKRNWALYDEAQEHEYPGVLGLIRDVVDEAANSYRLVRHDAAGKSGYFADEISKMLLAQQYEGRSDRVNGLPQPGWQISWDPQLYGLQNPRERVQRL